MSTLICNTAQLSEATVSPELVSGALRRRAQAMRAVNMDTELIRAQHAQLSRCATQVSLS